MNNISQFKRIVSITTLQVFVFGLLFTGAGITSTSANFSNIDCTSGSDLLVLGGGSTPLNQGDCEFLETIWSTTNPLGWTNFDNWNTLSDIGTWYGINRSGGSILDITLIDNALTGDIGSWDISGLTNLSTFNIRSNALTGDIGSWDISGLTNLSTFSTYDNALTGDIGSWDISGLTNLSTFNIRSNALTGDIGSWDISGLTNLSTFSTYNNALTGDIGSWDISGLTNLSNFQIQNNSFIGDIGSWDISGLTNLSTFNIRSNALTGDIGSWDISGLTNLSTFSTYDNALTGDIGSWDISGLTNLSTFSTYDNALTGDIGSWDISGLTNLSNFQIQNNSFIGDIGSWDISGLTNLSTFNIRSNALTGDIGSWDMSGLTNLSNFQIQNNAFTGDIFDFSNNPLNLSSNISYNQFQTLDSAKDSIADTKLGENWSAFQTITPNNLSFSQSGASLLLNWDPIEYSTGEYRVYYSLTSGGPYSTLESTINRSSGSSTSISGLSPDINYYFIVQSFTPANAGGNILTADSDEILITIIDNPPILILTGSGTITQEVGGTYTDQGATATDVEDDDTTLTSNITSSGSVNAALVGTYTIDYDVTDSSGNAAMTVTRTVNIVDTTAPVITENGSDPVTVVLNGSYSDAGATCSDNYDASCSVTSSGSVDTSTIGVYTITYTATDAAGNNATPETRTVNVVAGNAPVITLTGSGTITQEVGGTYTDQGATATDVEDDDTTLTSNITSSGSVNAALVGTYTIDYDVTDSSGNAAMTVTRTVNIVDTTAPVITENGSDPVTVVLNGSYSDAGATCSDNYDASCSVTSSGSVDTSTIGVYTITYNAVDAAGNNATPETRTVNVVAGNAPVITLTGSGTITQEVGGTYSDAGATATDTEDGNITGSITSSGSVNAALVGTYTIDYDVTDSSGNSATTVTRTVNIVDTTAPVITENGSDPVNVVLNGSYSDAGATCTDNYDASCSVTSSGSVDTSTIGVYTITYTATDAAGNNATPETRTVNVVAGNAPVITLTGSGTITQEVGGTYSDAGATATDTEDGDITGSITSSGSVNAAVVGTYTLDYDVTDSSGNSATTVTRTVNIVDTTAPMTPVINGPTSGLPITGTGEVGATLTVTTPSGATCTTAVQSDGSWSCMLSPNPTDGETISVTQTDPSGNTSLPATSTVNAATDTDGDGVPDRIEQQIGTDPTQTDTDTDGTDDSNNDLDNVSPMVELGAINDGDGNNDGTLDAIQNEVSSLPNTINARYNTLELSNTGSTTCGQINYFANKTETSLGAQDGSYNYNLGLWDFEISCSNTGATADIQIYLDTTYDTSSWVYRKHNEATNTYTDISSIVTYTTETVGTTPVTVINYSITDGGIYDEDGVANGVIIDPSGPAVRQSGGGGTGRVKYDRCDGNDTSGSIYDGKCSKDEEQAENTENENTTIDENTQEENIETPVDEEEEIIEEEIDKETKYTVENNFSSCPIIDDITHPNYSYQTSGKFVDENNSQFMQDILKFAEIGVVNGYDDGTFKPLREMTRTEFLKVALISHCYEYRELEGMTEYNDVEKNTWQARVIEKAQSLGMINGDRDEEGNKVFRPNDIISKAEAVKILMRISMIQARETKPTAYSDITVDWHTKYIENGEALGLFDSDKDNYNFKPDSGVKREDMIDLINRLVNLYR